MPEASSSNRISDAICRWLGDVGRVLVLFWFMSGLGLASLVLLALESKSPWRLVSAGLFLAGGAVLTGAVIGFLFGVPRRRSQPKGSFSYVPNTNLEKVSDWLTKVLIGAGLSQASDLANALERLAQFAGPAFAEGPAGPTIAGAVVVHYLFIGFFQGFLLAYLWLPKAFGRIFPPSPLTPPSP